MATIITNIDPYTLDTQTYSNQDLNLIAFRETPSQFIPNQNYVEYTILSPDQSFQITDQNFNDYKIINNTSPAGSNIVYNIDINPESDLINKGFTNGEYNVIYNFLNNELNSSSDNRAYYIKDISSDRTEVRIASNIINNIGVEAVVNDFISRRDLSLYFQDFYLNFGSNQLIIANNILLDNTKPQYEILINLYEALPSQFRLKDTLWVVTQVADPLAFNIQFQPEVIIPQITNPTIKGPNFDLSLKDRINNSTNYINYEELLTTGLASSQQQILSYLQDTSIAIGVDYSKFENFVHFSSAQSRIENFYYKIQLIEQYNSDITILGTSTSSSISESIAVLQGKVDNIIKNFDGYEYWLYYSSGSTSYPKGTSIPPYSLLYSEDSIVVTWYNNLIESASIYDQNNQDYLINTIPDYLRDDPQNNPYQVFINMIGQHYDNIWLYYKDVTNRYNGDNRLDFGISKDLVADALRSFGLKIYQNNFTTSDLYSAFTGFNYILSGSGNLSNVDDGNVYTVTPYIVETLIEGPYGYFTDDINYTPATTELITNYVSASQEALFEPVDDVNKEIYKRLYHNLPLLLKQKGTVAGLRNLINVYGVPDTILRISEFGGRDKDTSTYDYFQEKYGLTPRLSGSLSSTDNFVTTELLLSPNWDSDQPTSIQFRFNTNMKPSASMAPLGLFQIDLGAINSPTCSLVLVYTGSGYDTSSYSFPDSGSKLSPEYQYARLDFIPDTNVPNSSASVYLPFFDENWWSVMINRSGSTFELFAGNKLEYNGYDGNQIGFLASSSVTQTSQWGVNNINSRVRFFRTVYNSSTRLFNSGSIQEIRYWTRTGSLNSFKDFVMNPSSIDLTGETDYADYLAFRAPLGNELYINSASVHPKSTGSWATTSSFFINGNNFTIGPKVVFSSSIETVFLNSPTVGLRNRVTDKIQIVSQSLPQINLAYTQSGDTLSQYISIQQQYVSDQSEVPDVNALEVAFSPQNEIDDDIIASLGYFNIGEYIGDPRQVLTPDTSYPDLDKLSGNYFQKYTSQYDLFDYIRLIKFFDNSLFKMIKDFVPARTNLRSGVVVKQHLLERNKYPQPQMSWEDVTYSGSIDTAFFSGSTGGTFNEFNVVIPSNISGNIIYRTVSRLVPTVYSNLYENILGIGGVPGLLSVNDPYGNYFTYNINNTFTSNIQGTLYFTFSTDLFEASTYYFRIVSSTQGDIYETSYTTLNPTDTFNFTSSLTSVTPGEIFEVQVKRSGGILNAINNSYLNANITTINNQVWSEFEVGPTGSTFLIREDQREFYNGELPGTIIEASNGELNEANIFKYPSTLEINYDIVFYKSDITPSENFLNINTSPNQGEIYLWYDTGSILNPAPLSSFTMG